MKTGFFRALIGSCSGTEIFVQLREQKAWRALCHLVLMSLLCSVIISIGVYPGLQKKVRNSVDIAVKNCGRLVCSNKAVLPEKTPDQIKNFIVAGPLSVTYIPEKAVELPADFQKECSVGVIWNGSQIGLWSMYSANQFAFVPLSDPLTAVAPTTASTAKELLDLLKKTKPLTLDLPENKLEYVNKEKLQLWGELLLRLSWAGWMIRQNFIEVIIYIAMFMGVFLLMNIMRPHRLKFREMLVLAIYAGFPAMLAGSIADALQLPFFTFNMIYVFGMTIYLIIIMNRLERMRQERKWHDRPENIG